MDKFTRLTATACPLDVANLNTDQIVPARFLKRPRASGFGEGAAARPAFRCGGARAAGLRAQPPGPGAAPASSWAGRNFGCGSSREGAVYALYDYGIRCVIAPSFGDIFSGNAVQNGLLTAVVSDEDAAEIMATLAHAPELAVTVDLEQQTILCGNRSYRFAIDPVCRHRLLEGLDDIALTKSYRDRISAFKASDQRRRPWAAPVLGPAVPGS
jgi:3-isopropylmalate/(R)-2-methylmalate dehydratase small subunit